MGNLTRNPNFAVQVIDKQWESLPESVHMRGDNLSFADGHCEHWTWLEKNTLLSQPLYDVNPNNKDFTRLAGSYSTPLSGPGEF